MLTDLKIKNLKPTDKRREIPDGKVRGLYFIVQPSGATSWAVRYRLAGKPVKLTIGPYPAIDLATARRRAQGAIGEVAGGKDPAEAKKAAKAAHRAGREADDRRLDKVAASYVDRYVKRAVCDAWGREIDRQFRVEILPKLGHKHIGAITKADILDLTDAIIDRDAPIQSNRTCDPPAAFQLGTRQGPDRGVADAKKRAGTGAFPRSRPE